MRCLLDCRRVWRGNERDVLTDKNSVPHFLELSWVFKSVCSAVDRDGLRGRGEEEGDSVSVLIKRPPLGRPLRKSQTDECSVPFFCKQPQSPVTNVPQFEDMCRRAAVFLTLNK